MLARVYKSLTISVYLDILLPTVIVGFEPEAYNITEGNSTVEVCVKVSGVLRSSLSVSLTTVDGNATGEQG